MLYGVVSITFQIEYFSEQIVIVIKSSINMISIVMIFCYWNILLQFKLRLIRMFDVEFIKK